MDVAPITGRWSRTAGRKPTDSSVTGEVVEPGQDPPGLPQEIEDGARRRERVEPLLLHRRADQELSPAPRDEVDVGRADDVTEQLGPAEPYQLPLHGAEPERRQGRVDVAAPHARRQDRDVAGHAERRPAGDARDSMDAPCRIVDPLTPGTP